MAEKKNTKAKDKLDEFIEEKILSENLEDVVGERFGRYSKYIIQERAIPDVRDGLKPVQRRILYAMHMLHMHSDSPYRKSARIAGEVMGKYHPHGDSSIYEAMVRMSQTWKMGIPLIDMHGNNGSIDGDGPAAMRYTEARLSKAAELMLEDINPKIKTVPYVPNFDDEELEPVVLPSKFPNILVNGASGISAGYATEIPPHNLKEVIDAVIARIDNPNMNVDDVLKYIKGPDFPTGGIVQGLDGLKDAFTTGKGKIIVRSRTNFEEITKGQFRIVVTEIPYDVVKSNLVKSIDVLRVEKKLEGLLEVRDESDREGLRIAIDLKKDVNPEFILNYLFKKGILQTSYNYNMVAIYNHRPVCMGMLDILDAYIMHQKDFITNRSNHQLSVAKMRVHILDGLIKMVSILDEVIATIRQSKGKANAKENLIAKYSFTEEQAEAIVMLQLYRLSSTDVLAVEEEKAELNKKINYLTGVLSDEKKLLIVIKNELKEVSLLSNPRQSSVEDEIQNIKISEEELVTNEQVMIGVTKDGYIKRSSLRSFNSSKEVGLKEDDALIYQKEVSTLNVLLLFTNLGNYIYYPIYKIDDQKWKEIGIYVNNLVPISSNEKIINAFVIDDFNKDMSVLIASKKGAIKQTKLSDFAITRYSKSVKAMRLTDNDEVVSVDMAANYPLIVVFTKKGKSLRFKANELSYVGTQAGGVKAITMSDEVTSAIYTRNSHDILILTSRGNVKRIKSTDIPLSKRAKAGITVIKEIKANPHDIVGAVSMSYQQYQANVDVYFTTNKANYKTGAFEFKYQATDAGKPCVPSDLGKCRYIAIQKLNEDDIFDIDVEMEEIAVDIDDSIQQLSLFDDEIE